MRAPRPRDVGAAINLTLMVVDLGSLIGYYVVRHKLRTLAWRLVWRQDIF